MCCVDRWPSMLKKACSKLAIFSYDCLGTYLLPPLHMLCGSLVLNVEESLSRTGDLFVVLFIYGNYLLPPLHMLYGSLALNVEESLF
jgi:hypothetical protein